MTTIQTICPTIELCNNILNNKTIFPTIDPTIEQ
jgi:hypothetical protein